MAKSPFQIAEEELRGRLKKMGSQELAQFLLLQANRGAVANGVPPAKKTKEITPKAAREIKAALSGLEPDTAEYEETRDEICAELGLTRLQVGGYMGSLTRKKRAKKSEKKKASSAAPASS